MTIDFGLLHDNKYIQINIDNFPAHNNDRVVEC
jgi:hypothetical protein